MPRGGCSHAPPAAIGGRCLFEAQRLLEVLPGEGAKLLISVWAVKGSGPALGPALIRGWLLLEARRLLEVLR